MAYSPGSGWSFPATGTGTVTIPQTDGNTPRNVVIKVTALMATLAIIFPTATDSQTIRLSVESPAILPTAITLITMTCAAGDTIVRPLTTAVFGAGGIWTYSASDLSWHRWTS